jgi:transposase
MSRIHFSDRQWAFIRPLLPPPARTGRPRADDRRAKEGILYVLITGCRCQDLPHEYGAPTTVWQRLRRWGEEGVWERIWRAALAALDQQGELDWSMAFLDGSFAPAKNGGEQVGLTKKGKGTKWMLVVNGNGLPVGFHLASANTTEVRLSALRHWWRIAPVIVVSSATPCAAVASGCVSRPSAAPPRGAPNAAVPSSHATRSIGSATQWNGASLG